MVESPASLVAGQFNGSDRVCKSIIRIAVTMYISCRTLFRYLIHLQFAVHALSLTLFSSNSLVNRITIAV